MLNARSRRRQEQKTKERAAQIHCIKEAGEKQVNTKSVKDKAERKKLKRAARKKLPAKPKQTEPRGSHKPKVKKRGPSLGRR